MARNVVRALFTLSLFFLWTPRSQAQALSPYRAQVLSQKQRGNFKLHIFGLGLTELHLRPTKAETFGNVTVQSYRGKAILITRGKRTTRKTKEDVVAVGYVDSKGGKQLDVTFRTTRKMYRVHLGDGAKRGARVERHSLVREQRCPRGEHHPVTLPSSRSKLTQAAHQSNELREFREIEVAIDLDYEAKVLLKEKLVPSVVSLVETANLVFERDLGVRLKLSFLNTNSTLDDFPPETKTMGSFLDIFTSRPNYLGPADVYYLLVAREMRDYAGLAEVGLQCNLTSSPFFSYAVSEFRGVQNWVTFAHEMAHVIWATHTTEPGIMSTVEDGLYFHPTTQKQVSYFLSLPQSSCIEKVSLVPQPTPTATPTVTPTSTPQPTRTAVPTARPPILPPSLQLSLTQQGIVSGKVEVQNLSEGCTISILAGSSNSEMRRSREYAKTALTSSSMKIEGKLTSKLRKITANDRRRVYVAALHTCPGIIGRSSRSVVLNPFVMRKGRVTTYTTWVKQLARGLRIASEIQ